MDKALPSMTTEIGATTAPGRRPRLELSIFAIYLLLVLIGVASHEAWRDEIRAFTISLYANSTDKLFQLTQSEGHPLLWTILLKPFTLLPNQRGLKLAGLITAIPSAWVLFRMLPLPLWIRTGILFNYYWLYEYVVLSRSYAIGFMLTTLGLVLWLRQRSPIISATMFGLAANVHVLIALTNLPLAFYLASQTTQSRPKRWTRSILAIAAAMLIIGYGTALGSISQTRAMQYGTERIELRVKRYLGIQVKKPVRFRRPPPAAAGSARTATATTAAPNNGTAAVQSPAPPLPSIQEIKNPGPQVPRIKGKLLQWRNDSLIALSTLRDFRNNLDAAAWILLQVSGVGIAIAITLSAPSVTLGYMLPAVAIAVGFSEVVYQYSVWHKGIYTMILVYSLVLCRTQTNPQQASSDWISRGWVQAINARWFPARLGAISLSIFLIAGIFLGFNTWLQDLRLPFSGGQAAGYFLRQKQVPADNILIYDSPLAESGVSLAYGMPPLRADPAEAPTLLSWPRHNHFTWRPENEVRRFCDGAQERAVRSGSKAALVRLMGPMHPPNQPLCAGASAHFFPGIREPVQIELFEPTGGKPAGTADAP